mmetsp:Transcript_46573/g.119729  ORF Transcript_46573/g.119729 Transcript_46573/m.119729 type:complete len:92 (+) Transcript_46573:90-365(+)
MLAPSRMLMLPREDCCGVSVEPTDHGPRSCGVSVEHTEESPVEVVEMGVAGPLVIALSLRGEPKEQHEALLAAVKPSCDRMAPKGACWATC